MRSIFIFLAVGLAYLFSGTEGFSGIDHEKWDEFVRTELKSISDEVASKGKAGVTRPFVGDYDTNKDGFIDTEEVVAVNKFLGVTEQ